MPTLHPEEPSLTSKMNSELLRSRCLHQKVGSSRWILTATTQGLSFLHLLHPALPPAILPVLSHQLKRGAKAQVLASGPS